MLDIMPFSPLLVPLAIILYGLLHPTPCPDCGVILPVVQSPLRKTRRMWRAGGYLCARCGCEADLAGRKVPDGAPLPPLPARQLTLLLVLLMPGIAVGVFGLHSVPPPFPRARVALPELLPPAPAD